jgi:riboflavin synthase
MPNELRNQLVEKGSIAIDGVSLTVNELTSSGCRLTIVRFTSDKTRLVVGPPGRRVNVETDIIGKYVQHMVKQATSGGARSGNLTDLLRQYGYTDTP